MQMLTSLMTRPQRALFSRRAWTGLRRHVSNVVRRPLNATLRATAELLFGPGRGPSEEPIFMEVDPAEPGADTSWCEPPVVHPAEVERLLERIRDGDRGADLTRIVGTLQRLMPLLTEAGVPAHKLQGLELSTRQLREAAQDGGGFGLDMAWLLLEREVSAVGSALQSVAAPRRVLLSHPTAWSER